MRVKVLMFASLRERTGLAEIVRDVPEGATVGALWQLLTADHPSLAPYERSVSAAVNADYAKPGTALSDGDEVAFLPPVSGG